MANSAFLGDETALTPVRIVLVEEEELDPRFRYRAARLAAGYVVARDALQATQLSQSGLMSLETGITIARPDILDKLVEGYSMSTRFFEEGSARTPAEILADRLSLILERVANVELDPKTIGARLRQARMEAGYETLIGAANAKGWKAVTYQLHEVGRGGLPVDRFVGYALAFDVRPEFLFFGELPIRQSSETSTAWWKQQSSERRRQVLKAKPWSWLTPVSKKGVRLVIIEADGKTFRIAPAEKTVLPLQLVEAFGGAIDQYLFGIMRQVDAGREVVLLDPTSTDGQYLYASAKGDFDFVEDGPPNGAENPLEFVGDSTVARPLGKVVGRISFVPN